MRRKHKRPQRKRSKRVRNFYKRLGCRQYISALISSKYTLRKCVNGIEHGRDYRSRLYSIFPHKEPRTGGNTLAAVYKERFLALEITFLSRPFKMRLPQLMPLHV